LTYNNKYSLLFVSRALSPTLVSRRIKQKKLIREILLRLIFHAGLLGIGSHVGVADENVDTTDWNVGKMDRALPSWNPSLIVGKLGKLLS
jgi:hypothetical protein